ncbi:MULTISPECIES: hypothetical protein [unclassified Bradyrhizobium]|uniref:hypothetical protein n=1 Tax=unclassified Bradyrhizobium TaxID=2631580 RepID=UPI0028ECC158|nr:MULTISPECIES: hypothetical protein [unclassified Bradyrhizobium]
MTIQETDPRLRALFMHLRQALNLLQEITSRPSLAQRRGEGIARQTPPARLVLIADEVLRRTDVQDRRRPVVKPLADDVEEGLGSSVSAARPSSR